MKTLGQREKMARPQLQVTGPASEHRRLSPEPSFLNYYRWRRSGDGGNSGTNLEGWIGLGKAKMRRGVSSGSENREGPYTTYTYWNLGSSHFWTRLTFESFHYSQRENSAPQIKGLPGPAILFSVEHNEQILFTPTPELESFMFLNSGARYVWATAPKGQTEGGAQGLWLNLHGVCLSLLFCELELFPDFCKFPFLGLLW